MPYFRSTTKKTQVHTKNLPAFGMKYPGLVNTFTHRITNHRFIKNRGNNIINNVNNVTIKIPSWLKRQILLDANILNNDYSGNSLAITDDGLRFVAGIMGYDDQEIDQGSLFVFELSGGSYVVKDKLVDTNPTSGANLGSSVDITGDGKYIVGGIVNDDITYTDQGSIVVFKYLNDSYVYRQKLVDSIDGSFNDNLGHSVAISSDGKYIVGSSVNDTVNNDNQGSIVVFELVGTQFQYKQKLVDPQGEAYDNLGQSVDITSLTANNKYYIVAGTSNDDNNGHLDQGSINVFELSGAQFVHKQKLIDVDGSSNDNFGYAVAVSSNGKYIVGSSPNNNVNKTNQGSVLVFEFNGTDYVFKQKLVDPTANDNDNFGTSLSVSSDGKYIVVGVANKDSNAGALIVFELVKGSFIYRKTLVDGNSVERTNLGISTSVSNNGNYIIGGVTDTSNNTEGPVTVFKKK